MKTFNEPRNWVESGSGADDVLATWVIALGVLSLLVALSLV